MPGSSLWLLPPDDHPLQDALTTLIKQTSAHFKSPHLFIPHITLTSEISPEMYGEDPQAWLDSLPIVSKRELSIRFEKIDSEDVFFRKLYIKCEKLGGLEKLAKVCRKQVRGFEDDAKAVEWVKNVYNPHLSLLYHDCPQVEAEGRAEVENLAEAASVSLKGIEGMNGWEGGRVVLVPTDKPIDQWSPIAQKAR